jgi:hypothetical protein
LVREALIESYLTDIIRLPNKKQKGGRYHIDIIFSKNDVLYLCELKYKLSETNLDQKKLKKILKEYPTQELVSFFKKRIQNYDLDLKKTEPLIGVGINDSELPKAMGVLLFEGGEIKVFNSTLKIVSHK